MGWNLYKLSEIFDNVIVIHWENYKETYYENILVFKKQNYSENILRFFFLKKKQIMFFFAKKVGKNRIWFSWPKISRVKYNIRGILIQCMCTFNACWFCLWWNLWCHLDHCVYWCLWGWVDYCIYLNFLRKPSKYSTSSKTSRITLD